jgi:hypothetical protein
MSLHQEHGRGFSIWIQSEDETRVGRGSDVIAVLEANTPAHLEGSNADLPEMRTPVLDPSGVVAGEEWPASDRVRDKRPSHRASWVVLREAVSASWTASSHASTSTHPSTGNRS